MNAWGWIVIGGIFMFTGGAMVKYGWHIMPAKGSPSGVQQTMENSPGGVLQNMQDSPGSAQVAIGHVENVTLNAAPKLRVIPPKRIKELSERLKGGDPRNILIRSVLGDQESLALASQIAVLFTDAGWRVEKVQWAYSKPFNDIIFERGFGTGSHEQVASVVFAVLKTFGHEARVHRSKEVEANSYRLTVGSRRADI